MLEPTETRSWMSLETQSVATKSGERNTPNLYDKAESISTAYSHQSYTHSVPGHKAMEQLRHEDNLIADFANEQAQSESSDNESDARRKKRRRRNDPYSYLTGLPIREGLSDIDIRAALHWDNLLGRDTEPASALWSAGETEDVYLRYIDLSEAVDLTHQDNGKLVRQWAEGELCPKLCYGRCPNNCPQYSNIARGSKATRITRPTPDLKKEKTPELTDELQEPEMGSRTKMRRTKADFSSEGAAELLSQLHTTHT